MKFNNYTTEIFIPDNHPLEQAYARTTHMAVAAHQDDIEIMAYDGILKCFGRSDNWFSAVVVTNGAGSPRDNLYADFNDEQMQKVRRIEQKKAAYTGEYGSLTMLDYASSEVKKPANSSIVEDLTKLVFEAKPKVIYTHNPADKHETHVATLMQLIEALRRMPSSALPEKLYGCEVWRNLDWMMDDEKVYFDVSGHPNIAAALVEVFDSQICGGKRYDLATMGRRLSNATYSASHGVDSTDALIYAMDLTPLMHDRDMDIRDYVIKYIDNFKNDVSARLSRFI